LTIVSVRKTARRASSRAAAPGRGAWAGDRPQDAATAKRRLLEAAFRCFTREGVTRTTLADVAREAGVSRPTVYKHFNDRDGIVRALLLSAAPAFTGRLAAHVVVARSLEEGLVEALAFCFRELPNDPLFGVLFRDEAALRTSRLVLSSPEILEATAALLAPVVDAARQTGRLREGLEVVDIVEWSIRFLFSYALVPSPRHRGEEAMRSLAEQLLVPALMRDART
jgi:AcrR family transcriptional regulator